MQSIYRCNGFLFFKKIFVFKIQYGYARVLSGILISGNPSKKPGKTYIYAYRSNNVVTLLMCYSYSTGRDQN